MTSDQAVEVYKSQLASFDKTKDIQWKMNIAIWTVIILGIVKAEMIGKVFNCYVIVLLSVIFLGLHILFMGRIQRSLEANKIFRGVILEQLNSGVNNIQAKWNDKFSLPYTGKYWIFFQIVSTSVLIFIFCVLAINY